MAVKEVKDAEHWIESLIKLLECHGLGGSFKLPRILKRAHEELDMELNDFSGEERGIWKKTVDSAILSVLRNLRDRARIPGKFYCFINLKVPESFLLVGVADEWNYLKPDEVYVSIFDPYTKKQSWIEGPVYITRSPALHPGDVQKAMAIGELPKSAGKIGLRNVKNVVVFSSDINEKQPLCNKLGGGDLDVCRFIFN